MNKPHEHCQNMGVVFTDKTLGVETVKFSFRISVHGVIYLSF